MKIKRPAFQFYPGDWLRETSLRLCSVGARGLWIDMMCLMHQAEPYGHLVINGKGLSENPLARIEGVSVEEVRGYLEELETAGVFSRDENGVIFSRRMVRDEIARENRAKGGEAGAEHGCKGGRPRKITPSSQNSSNEGVCEGVMQGVFSEPQNNPPSSSSSSSSSSSKKEKKEKKTFDHVAYLRDVSLETRYSHIDIEHEQRKMEAWLDIHPGRKWNKAFILNWLDKIKKAEQPETGKLELSL